MGGIMTILYNTETQKTVSGFLNPHYIVDGQRPQLPQDLVELTVDYVNIPEYDKVSQRIQTEWVVNLSNQSYYQKHTIIDKSQYEILVEDWQFLNHINRIRIPLSLLYTEGLINTLTVSYLVKNKPIKFSSKDEVFYLYDNEFNTFTQNLISQFRLDIENIPTEKRI
jgi:hypothetical protein